MCSQDYSCEHLFPTMRATIRAVPSRAFGSMNVFDRSIKVEQRNAAARNAHLVDYEYLRDEVARWVPAVSVAPLATA